LGRVKEFTYLSNGLLSTEVWKSSGTPVNTMTYSYNADDQMLTAGDSNGTVSFTYDDLGRVKTQTDVWGIGLTFTSNDAGPGVTMTYSDGTSQLREDWTYNADNSVTDAKRYTDTAGTTLESE